MKWIMMFREAGAREKSRFRTVFADEEDLQGEKENLCMDFERETGEPWVCATIVPVPERKEERRDD